jgi:FAD synthase
VHIFDFNEDIYDQQVTVSFVDYIRPNRKFEKIEELVAQMDLDSAKAREILG